MAKRPTKDQWSKARITWESDSDVSDTAIAETLGISQQAVTQRRTKEQWARTGAMQNIQQRAQLAADRNCGEVVANNEKADVVEAAVEIRANVIERHRSDWAEHRKTFTMDAIATDFNVGKSAKISAEMLKIRQDGERRAYGLDDRPNAPEGSVAEALAELATRLPG